MEYGTHQTYLLVFTFGHLQARSFMCTHKYVFPLRSLESRARLYTDWTLIENLTQSSTVSRSKTLPRMAANKETLWIRQDIQDAHSSWSTILVKQWKLQDLSNTQLQWQLNTFAASYLNTQGLNNSSIKSPASTLVDLTFQSRALRSFSLNQLRNLSL